MKLTYTLAAALLLSIPYQTKAQDYCARTDLSYSSCDRELQRLSANDTDIKVALAYLVSKHIPQELDCPFKLKQRITKEAVKYLAERLVFDDSLNVSITLPSVGELQILTTDQALEVAYVVAEDVLFTAKAKQAILSDAGRTYVREKIVQALVWLLSETSVENLLPSTLTDSEVYPIIRAEVARYWVDRSLEGRW